MVGGAGRPYSSMEKKAIVDYIVKHNAYAQIKGNLLWKEMEKEFPNRTWQSLREHFRKQIYSKLHYASYELSREQIQYFRDIFEHKRPRRNPTPKVKDGFDIEDLETDSDSDETVCDVTVK